MNEMKVDVLAIGVHPDDIELSCGGTLIKMSNSGKKIALLDLTCGEMGTRGTPTLRLQEAEAARKIMGAMARENLHYRDCFFVNDETHQLGIIKMIRKYQPEIVIANALDDRHPDHGRAGKLIADACFYSGLEKLISKDEHGIEQKKWRPRKVFHMIQDTFTIPNFVVDITNEMNRKMEAIMAYSSQFYDPNSKETPTYISSPHFMEGVKSRATTYGKYLDVPYGEGFISVNPIGVYDLFAVK
jgi:N-acetylglucosamine malate deacetylase 1